MRQLNWSTLLREYVESHHHTAFEWGVFDCCLFVADAIKAMTGEDFATEFRGKYTSKLGALRALKKHGTRNLTDTLIAKFGQPIAPLLARRGDIALIDNDEGETLAIFYGGGLLTTSAHGLTSVSNNNALLVWSID